MNVKIAQISCGTYWSGVQKELERAADTVGAELVFPEVDLESIQDAVDEIGLDVKSPNLKLMAAKAKSIVDGFPADALLLLACFGCSEGTLARDILREYLQENVDLPMVVYSFTEAPKFGGLLTRLEALVTVVKRKALLASRKQEGLSLGIDSGSSMTKAVVMEDDEIIGSSWAPTGDILETAEKVKGRALEEAGIQSNRNPPLGATGYGRGLLEKNLDPKLTQEELTVVSKGAAYMEDRQEGEATVVDIGGLDNKAMSLLSGIPHRFTMGGLCAGASGRFLELASARIGVDLEEFGEFALKGNPDNVKMDSYCAIFGIQDLVSALSEGISKVDVAAAACHSVAKQVFEQQLQEIDLREPIIQVGGTALVQGLVEAMQSVLKMKTHVPEYPQYMGAVGAAMLASVK